ncbi:MAG: hypothetical protein ACYDEY_00880 [Acidimicrobiales bacterium]
MPDHLSDGRSGVEDLGAHDGLDEHGSVKASRNGIKWSVATVCIVLAMLATYLAMFSEMSATSASKRGLVALAKHTPRIRPAPPGRVAPNLQLRFHKALASVPTMTELRASLRSQHVSVSVNGSAIQLRAIAGAEVGFDDNFLTSAIANANQKNTSIAAAVSLVQKNLAQLGLRTAVAYEVLQSLLWQSAHWHHAVVSEARAMSMARQNYAIYIRCESSHTCPAPPPPAGVSVHQMFFDPRIIHGYQMLITVNNERAAVGGKVAYAASGSGALVSRTPALAHWMRHELSVHRVVLKGIPGIRVSDLPALLPKDL